MLLPPGAVPTIRKAIVQLDGAAFELRRAMRKIKGLIYSTYYDEVKDMTEMKEFTPADIRRNIAHAIEDAGIEETIHEIGIDKVIAAVGIDKLEAAIEKAKVTRY